MLVFLFPGSFFLLPWIFFLLSGSYILISGSFYILPFFRNSTSRIFILLLPDKQVGESIDLLSEQDTDAVLVNLTFEQIGEILLVEETDVLRAAVVEAPFQGDVIDVGARFVMDGIVVVGSARGFITALNQEDGKILWEHELGGGPVQAKPLIADNLVFTGIEHGNLEILDAKTGQISFTFETEYGVFSSPAYSDGIFYFFGKSEVAALQ